VSSLAEVAAISWGADYAARQTSARTSPNSFLVRYPLAQAVIAEWLALVIEVSKSDASLFGKIPALRALLEEPGPAGKDA